ncbi:MAG: SulP family inorganic anion transporter [Gammaproteobacteria bacterium]|nr:SulP family inorganic anion transporter [Gammaproteobacteria bacterium]
MLHFISRYHLTQNPRSDILSGLTVAIALVPEAVAFAFVAKVDPLVGLYAAFIICLITAVLGGRPGMISGATGALAVVMTSLVVEHGIEYLFATVVLMGLIQVLAGVFRLGKFIRLVPHPVMLGFVNGLAIVIFLAQRGQFMDNGEWLEGPAMSTMLGLTFMTLGLIFALPRLLPQLTRIVPAPLIAIVTTTLLVIGFSLDTRVVADLASVQGGLPTFHIPTVPLNFETFSIILPYAVILAAIGLIESLLTLNLIDEMTETRGQTSRECVGQGVANVTCGFFGGMGGCAMIGQSMININSGGRGRLSGIAAASFLILFILVGSRLIESIPLAALVGLMFFVVIKTFAWASLKTLRQVPKEDYFVMLLVTVTTVFTDLAIAVLVGVIASALVFAWKSAHHIWAETSIEQGSKVYRLHGPLFFGSISQFRELFDPKNDPADVVLDFGQCRVWDHSALEAIDSLATRYQDNDKRLHITHLSPDCILLLKKAGGMVEVNSIEDPHYRVVVDYARELKDDGKPETANPAPQTNP